LYKPPWILILNEATSPLDPLTEQLILDTLTQLKETIPIV